MKRYITRVLVLLLAGILISCGGGGGGDDSASGAGTPATSNPGNGGGDPGPVDGGGSGALPSAGAHVEESDAALVILTGEWTPSEGRMGWSGGAARQSTVAGASASFAFTGTSVTWIGSRGPYLGIALVKIDGNPVKEVQLYSKAFEARTRVVTLYDLTDGPHTLTIEVTGRQHTEAFSNVVVVDAFEVQPQILSHLQETDPDVSFSGGWVHLDDGKWSGGGVRSGSDPSFGGARAAETAGETVALKFRGTSVSWIGSHGPNAGIARVRVDEGAVREVDLYTPKERFQAVVFTASGLAGGADRVHTLTIEATGRKNAASTGAQIVVDAFDVTTPGRRYEEYAVEGDPTTRAGGPKITYTGNWVMDNLNRVWSEGMAAKNSLKGDRATFTFTGTSVSWIGCEKSSIGSANIYLDGAFVKTVNMNEPVGIEGYQRTIYRVDGLTDGPHTLTIEAAGGLTVVDAFDVHP